MYFPLADVLVHPLILAAIGFLVGVMGGFFGVGGSFIAGPAMFFVGVPMNFVVGTDLAHIVGKSVVAAKRHRTLGHVDIKLGLLMVLGTMVGVEMGAQVVEFLKAKEAAEMVIGVLYIVILITVSLFTGWEARRSIVMMRTEKIAAKDALGFKSITRRVRAIRIPPLVRLPNSGIESISLWAILAVGLVTGFFGGLLGGGAGYMRLPALIYFLGVPTHVAIGTDLFEVVISAGYGTLTHAFKGNVDILIALVMHTGAAIGAQIGAVSTRFVGGPKIRLGFSFLPFIGAALVLYRLLGGGVAG
jgi:uncharacterized membrane protein YfcA